MNTEDIHSLQELIRHAGEAWMLNWFKPPEKASDYLRNLLERVNNVAKQRFPQGTPRVTEENLIDEYKRAPHKVRAFIQSLAESESPDLLLMVWRILQGMEIERVEMSYTLEDRFFLEVTLRSPYGDPAERYQSDSIDDAALIRHFGIMKMNGRPVFDGFYASEPRQ